MLVGLSPCFTVCVRIAVGRGGLGTVLPPPGSGRGGSVVVEFVVAVVLVLVKLEQGAIVLVVFSILVHLVVNLQILVTKMSLAAPTLMLLTMMKQLM